MSEVPTTTDDAVLPWEPSTNVHSSIHMLATGPTVTFESDIYPSLVIKETGGYDSKARFDLSLTGTPEQRAAFVASLRDCADRIAAWTPADGTVPEPTDESAVPA